MPARANRLGPALVRHVIAYGDLAADETGQALRAAGVRFAGVVIAIAAGSIAALLACAAIMAATWDGPYRVWVITLLWAAFTGLAVPLWITHRPGAPPRGPQPFERLRAEWREDRRILEAQLGTAAPEPTP